MAAARGQLRPAAVAVAPTVWTRNAQPHHARATAIKHADRVLELLDTHGVSLHRQLWRLTAREQVAEDLLQDLVIRLSTSSGFAEAEHPVAYARRAATNLALDWRRARKRRPRLSPATEAQTLFVCPLAGPVEAAARAESRSALFDAFSKVTEVDRLVLTQRFFYDLSFPEVGANLTPPKTAQQARALTLKALHHIRKRLGPVFHAEATFATETARAG